MRFQTCLAAAAAALVTGVATSADAGPAPPPPTAATYLGEVRAFGFNFCPQGWLPADGRNMPIAQNPALFSLLATSFGGNGTTYFSLPDLRGRTPIGTGAGVSLGQRSSAQPGEQSRFLGMTWCIAVDASYSYPQRP
jgi:microcystin-dependent protein